MKFYPLSTALAVSCTPLPATAAAYTANQIADAIYRAEGGSGTKHPYGVLSVRVKGAAEARQVCIRTILFAHKDWVSLGSKGSFIRFLGDRYCPRSVDPTGNRNWVKNVSSFLK